MFDGSLRVNPHSKIPRHVQVQALLRTMLETGQLKPGDKIPAEVQIAAAFGVSKMTVNKALLALTQEGVIVREVGRGTFIKPAALEDVSLAVSSPSTLPRIVLSSAEGVSDLFGSDYYGVLYQGITEYLSINRENPKAELRLSSPTSAHPPSAWPSTTRDYLHSTSDRPNGWLILAPRDINVPFVNEIWEQGHTCMVVGASWPTLHTPWVDSGNYGGSVSAIQHLISLGHRRIALLYAEPETANTQDRIAGYRHALADANIAYTPSREVAAEQMWMLGATASARLKELLIGPGAATAIFAAGYYLALETITRIHELGLTVPKDVSVVGFDDPVGAPLSNPPLTTVRQPLRQMGYHAAERLLQMVRSGARHVTRDTFPAEVVVRRSTAPVAVRGP